MHKFEKPIGILFATISVFSAGGLAIDCFRCSSIAGSSPWCEDPFHNNYSASLLQSPCWAGRKGRDGLYPATACIKLNGQFGNGEKMTVRDCALDSGSLTTDTELVRMSHCGGFYFNNRYVRGCVQSCFENACNWAPRRSLTKHLTTGAAILSSLLATGTISLF